LLQKTFDVDIALCLKTKSNIAFCLAAYYLYVPICASMCFWLYLGGSNQGSFTHVINEANLSSLFASAGDESITVTSQKIHEEQSIFILLHNPEFFFLRKIHGFG